MIAPSWAVIASYACSISALVYVVPRAWRDASIADRREHVLRKLERVQAMTERRAPR